MTEIHRRVDMWAEAWSAKDVVGYLSYYSSDFISQGGAPFEPWAQLRFERIAAPEWIHVIADDLKISVNNDSAVAEFVQQYSSPDFSSESRKTLVFELEGESWKIIRETVQPQ
jgi:ketosteroid isomerase-like protein